MGRYEDMFKKLAERKEGAFVPFTVIGDPDIDRSIGIIRALVAGGADALELGVPFSDPVADGPTIQSATVRAIEAGATPKRCWEAIRRIRDEGIEIPIGILSYANMAVAGGVEAFYSEAHAAGVDSVLLADVPCFEFGPFARAAKANGIDPVLIAPPNADDACLERIATLGSGYTYLLARSGTTGADERLKLDHSKILKKLKEFHAPPPLIGFGVSKPEHVREAIEAGANGAICGSAIVGMIGKNTGGGARLEQALSEFVRSMKEATV